MMRPAKLMSSCAMLGVLWIDPVVAQTATQTEQPEAAIADIVVTATKRSGGEALQRAPISASAFNSQMLERRGVADLVDLDGAAPNVQLETIGTAVGTANFTIRGFGIIGTQPSEDPPVGVFVDGVFLGSAFGVITDTFDLESVEVLRGPQGLLFGRNVAGGAVLLRTRRPNGETNLRGKLGYESPKQVTAAVSGETAIVPDRLFGKVSIYYNDDDGWLRNSTVGRRIGKLRTLDIRPTLVWKPSDRLETTLIWDHGRLKGDGGTAQAALPNDPPDGLTNNFTSNQNEPGVTDNKWDQITSETTGDIGFATLTNILGYRRVRTHSVIDVDASPLTLFHGTIDFKHRQVSEELRLNAKPFQSLETIAGFYYFNAKFDLLEQRLLNLGATRVAGGGDQKQKVLGAFVTNIWTMSDHLSARAGLRYSSETKDAVISSLGSCDPSSLVCRVDFRGSTTSNDWVPLVSLQWKPTDHVNAYAQWTKGYRSGGFNFRDVPGGSPPSVTEPENLTAFEVGVKTDLFDRRARFNVSLFHNKIKGIQRTVVNPDTTFGNEQVVLNVGDGTIKGIELEATVKVGRYFTIGANAGFQDFHYDKLIADLTGDGVVNAADLDLDLVRFAHRNYALNAEFAYPLASGSEIGARVDYTYRSPSPMSDNNQTFGSSMRMLNASLTYTAAGSRWTVRIYGANLLNDVVQENNLRLPATFAALGAPRYVTIEKGRRFGAELGFSF